MLIHVFSLSRSRERAGVRVAPCRRSAALTLPLRGSLPLPQAGEGKEMRGGRNA